MKKEFPDVSYGYMGIGVFEYKYSVPPGHTTLLQSLEQEESIPAKPSRYRIRHSG